MSPENLRGRSCDDVRASEILHDRIERLEPSLGEVSVPKTCERVVSIAWEDFHMACLDSSLELVWGNHDIAWKSVLLVNLLEGRRGEEYVIEMIRSYDILDVIDVRSELDSIDRLEAIHARYHSGREVVLVGILSYPFLCCFEKSKTVRRLYVCGFHIFN